MRGDDRIPDEMFSYVRPEERVPADHPLRPIRTMVDDGAPRVVAPRSPGSYAKTGPALHPAGAAAPRPVAPDALLDPERAAS